MTASNFLACFNETASFEGGYSDSPHDPGGATMAGVTQAVYTAWLAKHGRPNAAVKEISIRDRQAIYREEYWDAVRADELPVGVDLVVVDTAWGSGPRKAILILQHVVGVAVDGDFGPNTLAAVQRISDVNRAHVIDMLCAERLAFFKSLSIWQYFGVGWTRRLDGIHTKALEMSAGASDAAPSLVTTITPKHTGISASPIPVPSPAERLEAIKATLATKTATEAHAGILAQMEAWLARWERWL